MSLLFAASLTPPPTARQHILAHSAPPSRAGGKPAYDRDRFYATDSKLAEILMVSAVASSQMLFFLSFVFILGQALGQPIFPDGIAPVVKSLAQRQADVKRARKDEAGKLAELKQGASLRLQGDLAAVFEHSALAAAAYERARTRLLKGKFLGGCARDFGGCPMEWTLGDDGCQPPNHYTGLCGASALLSMPTTLKEDFAWRCKANYPCVESCKRNFAECPVDWIPVGKGLCVAPQAYEGPCSPATDFSHFSRTGKAVWANRCGALW